MLRVLFVNSVAKTCGVYQYGHRLARVFKKTTDAHFDYVEVSSAMEYHRFLENNPPYGVVVYNYHPGPMGWLNSRTIRRTHTNVGILHDPCATDFFDFLLDSDPGAENGILRPLFQHTVSSPPSMSDEDFRCFVEEREEGVPVFGSFGFGFTNKGFHKVIQMVNEQYDRAIIKLLITRGAYVPDHFTNETLALCRAVRVKEGIQVRYYEKFVEDDELLWFLSSTDMNIFLYDRMEGRGISSVMDYALSVDTPLGISDSDMFRHIYDDGICLYKNPIETCRKNSMSHCQQFREAFCHANLLYDFFKKISQNALGRSITTTMYSQAGQDLFALLLNGHKKGGFFLEIGANHPFQGNNTYLLETDYDWRGIMVEYDAGFRDLYLKHRPNSVFILQDARKVEYRSLLVRHQFPTDMNYLQIDLDADNRSTLTTLELLDQTVFGDYKFGAVTFEHDFYRGDFFHTKQASQDIFQKRGYELLFDNVSVFFEGKWCIFEDWYAHPTVVSPELINAIQTHPHNPRGRGISHSQCIAIMRQCLGQQKR